jgi:outer membrane lipoprotein-sorting protein
MPIAKNAARSPRKIVRRKSVLAMLLPAALFWCLGWADSLETLKAATGKITSVKADFVQSKHLKILSKPLISKGVIYYKSPGSLRWEYIEPIRSILLAHNGKTKRFHGDGDRFSEENSADTPFMQVVMTQISQWFAGNFNDDALFSARMELGRKIVLTPKNKNFTGIIAKIELYLSNTPGVIDRVMIHEGADAYTRMDFSQTSINPELADDIFQKTP